LYRIECEAALLVGKAVHPDSVLVLFHGGRGERAPHGDRGDSGDRPLREEME
jgi:hypothetical protein